MGGWIKDFPMHTKTCQNYLWVLLRHTICHIKLLFSFQVQTVNISATINNGDMADSSLRNVRSCVHLAAWFSCKTPPSVLEGTAKDTWCCTPGLYSPGLKSQSWIRLKKNKKSRRQFIFHFAHKVLVKCDKTNTWKSWKVLIPCEFSTTRN